MTSDFAVVRAGWEKAASFPGPLAMRAVARSVDKADFYGSGKSHCDMAVAVLPPITYPTIIELGCGLGRVTYWLGRAGYERVYAVDIAPSMVGTVNRLLSRDVIPSRVVATVLSNGADLTTKADGVYSTLCLMHNTRANVRAIMKRLHTLLPHGKGRVAFQLPVYDRPVEVSTWRDVAQWTRREVLDLACSSGYVPRVVWSNPGTYVKGDPTTIGAHHFDLHVFDKETTETPT